MNLAFARLGLSFVHIYIYIYAGGVAGASVEAVGKALEQMGKAGAQLGDLNRAAGAMLDVDASIFSEKDLQTDLGDLRSLQMRLSPEFLVASGGLARVGKSFVSGGCVKEFQGRP